MNLMDGLSKLFGYPSSGTSLSSEPTQTATAPTTSTSLEYSPPPGAFQALMTGKPIDWQRTLRAIAVGAGSPVDPAAGALSSFASGMAGTAKYLDEQDKAAYERMLAERKIDAASAKSALDESQSDREFGLKQEELKIKQAAEERRRIIDERRAANLAKGKGLTVDQQLQIERLAQAAADDIYDPEEREEVINATRDRLTAQVKQEAGLSGGTGITQANDGISNARRVTATGPNGQKIVLQDGKWVPLTEGK